MSQFSLEDDKTEKAIWEKRIAVEMERRRPVEWLSQISYFMERLFKRCVRIVVGVAIGFISFVAFEKAYDVLSLPFASLSPMKLIGGIGLGVVGFYAAWGTWWAAFGPGPTKAETEKVALQARRHAAEERLRAIDRANAQKSWLYSIAKAFGRLIREKKK